MAPPRPPAHSIWATFLPPRSAACAIVSAWSTPGSNAAVLLPNGWPFTWKVLLVEPVTPGQAPVASVNQPAPVFGGAWVSRPLPEARAPLRRSSRKPGTTPWSAYFSTASWRRPSEAKKRSLSSRLPSCPPPPCRPESENDHAAPAPVAARAVTAARTPTALARTLRFSARLDTTFVISHVLLIVRTRRSGGEPTPVARG